MQWELHAKVPQKYAQVSRFPPIYSPVAAVAAVAAVAVAAVVAEK